eukprot:TRINITY_DN13510_c0_g1_i1.p2 TRINITY_DN13510_c0_g1~~TRINITY_DN13510_c0_g1_i1.p2  ORF type:complete len:128 (-),score=20.75 TRINITY_DN13510_c0_g1_i1:239-622(-)
MPPPIFLGSDRAASRDRAQNSADTANQCEFLQPEELVALDQAHVLVAGEIHTGLQCLQNFALYLEKQHGRFREKWGAAFLHRLDFVSKTTNRLEGFHSLLKSRLQQSNITFFSPFVSHGGHRCPAKR